MYRRIAAALATAAVATSVAALPANAANGSAALTAIQAQAVVAVNNREAQLQKLSARLTTAPGCDAGGKVAGIIAADEPALTQLGQKIAADTTLAVARTDFQSIFNAYRVYADVTPQANVTAACGLIEGVVTRLQADQTKLSQRVAAAAAAGASMSAAQAAVQDMSTQLSAATTASSSGASALAGIQPDHGVASVIASNAAAVSGAHVSLQTAHDDLAKAVADGRTVVADLQAAGGTTTTTS